eukprot:810568-Rhodomonas_salina.2
MRRWELDTPGVVPFSGISLSAGTVRSLLAGREHAAGRETPTLRMPCRIAVMEKLGEEVGKMRI